MMQDDTHKEAKDIKPSGAAIVIYTVSRVWAAAALGI